MLPASANFPDSTLPDSTGATLQPLERLVLGTLGIGLSVFGLRGSPGAKLVLTGAGLGLVTLAVSGSNPLATALKIRQDKSGETLVNDAVTIGKPAEELYAIWRQLETLPNLMTHLQEVRVLDEKRSHWTVRAPVGEVGWDAELVADEPGRRVAWASVPGTGLDNSGEVLFRPAPGDRGTEVVVRLKYRAPGGSSGALIARMFGQEPSQQLRDDLMRFKREQELGYAPTTQGQSSGRAAKSAAQGGQR